MFSIILSLFDEDNAEVPTQQACDPISPLHTHPHTSTIYIYPVYELLFCIHLTDSLQKLKVNFIKNGNWAEIYSNSAVNFRVRSNYTK